MCQLTPWANVLTRLHSEECPPFTFPSVASYLITQFPPCHWLTLIQSWASVRCCNMQPPTTSEKNTHIHTKPSLLPPPPSPSSSPPPSRSDFYDSRFVAALQSLLSFLKTQRPQLYLHCSRMHKRIPKLSNNVTWVTGIFFVLQLKTCDGPIPCRWRMVWGWTTDRRRLPSHRRTAPYVRFTAWASACKVPVVLSYAGLQFFPGYQRIIYSFATDDFERSGAFCASVTK